MKDVSNEYNRRLKALRPYAIGQLLFIALNLIGLGLISQIGIESKALLAAIFVPGLIVVVVLSFILARGNRCPACSKLLSRSNRGPGCPYCKAILRKE